MSIAALCKESREKAASHHMGARWFLGLHYAWVPYVQLPLTTAAAWGWDWCRRWLLACEAQLCTQRQLWEERKFTLRLTTCFAFSLFFPQLSSWVPSDPQIASFFPFFLPPLLLPFLFSVNISFHFCGLSLSFSLSVYFFRPLSALAPFQSPSPVSRSSTFPRGCSPSPKCSFCEAPESPTLLKANSFSQQFHCL